MANTNVNTGILMDYNNNPFLPRTVFSQVFKDSTGESLLTLPPFNGNPLPVSMGGTGKNSLDSGKALIGDGTNAVSLRSITNNTTATAVAASTNLITANTLYYHKGNSNIVNVGTITSGTWQGTDVGLAYGGTGVSLSNNPSMLVNLGSTTADTVFEATPRPGVTGTLALGNGGTGATTALAAQKNLLDGMVETTTAISDDSWVVFKYTTPTPEKGTLLYKKASLLWDYAKSKMSSVFGLGGSSGNATFSGTVTVNKSLTLTEGSGVIGKGTSTIWQTNGSVNGLKMVYSGSNSSLTLSSTNVLLQSTSSLFLEGGANITVHSTEELYLDSGEHLYMSSGKGLVLDSSMYGSLDDMNALTPVEGQVFFVLN